MKSSEDVDLLKGVLYPIEDEAWEQMGIEMENELYVHIAVTANESLHDGCWLHVYNEVRRHV